MAKQITPTCKWNNDGECCNLPGSVLALPNPETGRQEARTCFPACPGNCSKFETVGATK